MTEILDKLKTHTLNKADESFQKHSSLFLNVATVTVDKNGEVIQAIDMYALMEGIITSVISSGMIGEKLLKMEKAI